MVGRANGESPRAGVGGATGYEYPCKWRLAASVGTSRTHFSLSLFLSLVLGGKRVRAGLPRAQSAAKRRKRGCFFSITKYRWNPRCCAIASACIIYDLSFSPSLPLLFLLFLFSPYPSTPLYLLLILRPIHRPLPSSSISSLSLSLFLFVSFARCRQRRVPRARSLVFPP